MEGFIGSSVCRGVRSCWARRGSCNGYQRLPRAAPTTTPGRGTRLGRRTVLGSAAWSRFGRLRRRRQTSTPPRWSSPLQLLNRILDTYIASMLSQPLNILKAGVSSAAAAAPVAAVRSPSSSPPKLRRDASPGSESRRRDAAGGRGVMLNICVAEVLLRRTTSEVRRSPLQQQQQPTKDARRSSVRA
ncbi:unnamed protein product [Miscanthus lutarioriparius]|uniref:Uncharacterized protein n=1 Tax=Miscanthus lutarioriparius TaxID=422564 RepID=A0A811P283_9POAL|nr:unnamed protein product [Miscanthus lutarioriparius]